VKITGYRGPLQIPPIRISGGIYGFPRADGTWIYRKRPVQPATNDEASQYNRDLMRYSAWLASEAQPLEVQTARNFEVNSNDTWKDILTRAQFGTLFRVYTPEGEPYHPADHSLPQPEPPQPGMANFDLLLLTPFVTGTPLAQIDFAIPAGYTELICMMRLVGASSAGIRVLQYSVDNGATFKSGASDYKIINTNGTETNAAGSTFNLTSTTSQQSGAIWIPNVTLGQGTLQTFSPQQSGMSTIFVASAQPVTNIRFKNGAGNLTGTTSSSYYAIIGR